MSQNGPDQDPWGKPGQSSGPKQSDNSSDKQNENGWGARDNKNQEQSPPDIEEVFNYYENQYKSHENLYDNKIIRKNGPYKSDSLKMAA